MSSNCTLSLFSPHFIYGFTLKYLNCPSANFTTADIFCLSETHSRSLLGRVVQKHSKNEKDQRMDCLASIRFQLSFIALLDPASVWGREKGVVLL